MIIAFNYFESEVITVKYKTGQTLNLKDGYELTIDYASPEENTIDFTLWDEYGDWYMEGDDVPEATIDAIITQHSRR